MICSLADWNASKKFVPRAMTNYELTHDKLNRCSKVLSSGSLNNIKDNEVYYVSSDVSDMPTPDRAWGFVRTTMYGDSTGFQEFFSVTEPRESYVRVLRQNTWQSWKKQSDNVYYTQSTSTSIANLLYTAANALGYSPTERTHAGLISVSTDTIGQYALIWFMYKHGTTGQGIQVSNNVIALSAINSAGTLAITGGTAPYNIGVMFFY